MDLSSKMKLNICESNVMWFLRKRASASAVPPTIVIDNHQLKEVDKQNYLLFLTVGSPCS